MNLQVGSQPQQAIQRTPIPSDYMTTILGFVHPLTLWVGLTSRSIPHQMDFRQPYGFTLQKMNLM